MSLPSRRTMEIGLGALFLVSLGVLVYMALRMGALSSLAPTVHVTVNLHNATGLVENASVRIAGVEVGKVRSLTVDFDQAVVGLELRRDAGIRRDVVAALRARSLLGEKFIELTPVSRDAPPVEEGDVLTAAEPAIELERLADTLGPVIEGIKSEEISASALRVLTMLEQQQQPIEEMLARINRILAKVEKLPLDDPRMVADVRASLTALRTTAESLPNLTTRADQLLSRGDSMLASAQPTLDNVNAASAELPKLMKRVDELSLKLDEMLAVLGPQVKRLESIDYKDLEYLLRSEGLLVRFMPVGDLCEPGTPCDLGPVSVTLDPTYPQMSLDPTQSPPVSTAGLR